MDAEQLLSLVSRKLLTPSMVSFALRQIQAIDSASVKRVLNELDSELLVGLEDILSLYPWSDRVWSLLPQNRLEYVIPDVTRNETGELERLPFLEDRPVVEALRSALKVEIDKRGIWSAR